MPPVEAELTDGDSDDEEETQPKDQNHLGRGVLSQEAELVLYNGDPATAITDREAASTSTSKKEEEDRGAARTRTSKKRVRTEQEVEEVIEEEEDKGAARTRTSKKRVRTEQEDEEEIEEDRGAARTRTSKKRVRTEEEDEEIEEDRGAARTRTSKKRVRTEQEEEEEEEMEEEDENEGGRKLGRTKNTDRRWKSTKPMIFGMAVPEFQEQPLKTLPDGCYIPYEFFKLFVTDEFVDYIADMSQQYAGRKGQVHIQPKLTHNNIRITHAIMYMTGYIRPSNRRMYWERREDSRNSLVAKTMTEATFTSILRHTTFVNNTVPDPNDRYWKVRPLFDQINSCAKQWIKHPEKVSIDEAMVKYFGPHPLKQFMRGKPHRFGYKVWVMASSTGELLACQPYAGASTMIKDYGQGQGPNVVLGLAEQCGLLLGAKVYCVNLFTSLDLLEHMGDRHLGVTGTMRQNRLHGIPLPTKKEVAKNFERGQLQAIYHQDAMVLVWKDNQPVYMASNHDSVEPMGTCQRYSQKEKGYVAVHQPKLNHEYNTNMGGVDLLDNGEKNYAITARIKKWYWCLYAWFLNVSMVQAWRLYRAHMPRMFRLLEEAELEAIRMEEDREERKEMEENWKKRRVTEKRKAEIPLLEFTRQVVDTLFMRHSDPHTTIVPQQNVVLSSSTLEEARFDSGRHLVRIFDVRGVCKECKARTKYRCIRCNVALHPDVCFYKFHTPEEEWQNV